MRFFIAWGKKTTTRFSKEEEMHPPFENEHERRMVIDLRLIRIYVTQTRVYALFLMKRNIQSDEAPFAAFLLVRVRVRRVVFTDHVFRVRERVPTDAGFFRSLCGGANGRFASFFREFFLLDG